MTLVRDPSAKPYRDYRREAILLSNIYTHHKFLDVLAVVINFIHDDQSRLIFNIRRLGQHNILGTYIKLVCNSTLSWQEFGLSWQSQYKRPTFEWRLWERRETSWIIYQRSVWRQTDRVYFSCLWYVLLQIIMMRRIIQYVITKIDWLSYASYTPWPICVCGRIH